MRLVLFEPAARTSNEIDLWGRMPDVHMTVVSDRDGWDVDQTIVLPARRLPWLGHPERWTAALAWLTDLDRIPELVDPEAIDAVVSLELFSVCTAQASLVARRLGVPHLVHVAETMARNPLYRVPPWAIMTRRFGLAAEGFICMTERARAHLITLGVDRDRTRVVQGGVDLTTFTPHPDRLCPEPKLICISQLRKDGGVDKGIDELFDSFAAVRRALPGARLTLVGDGGERERLEQRAAVEGGIDVVGSVDRSRIPSLLQEHRALVLNTRDTWKIEEQFGFVLLEAMACGLAVVGSVCGSIPEVIGRNNVAVPQGDNAGLATALIDALGPNADTAGRRNRQRAEEMYSVVTQRTRLRDAVTSLLTDGE